MPLWQPSKAVARPVYYDREPAPVIEVYGANLAAHGVTQRITYGPADGFAAFIEVVMFDMICVGFAVAGQAYVAASLTPYYGGGARQFDALNLYVSALGVHVHESLPYFGYMAFGDSIAISTFSNAGASAVGFNLGVKGTDFIY